MREISASLIQVLIRKRQGDPYDQKNTDSVPYAYAGGGSEQHAGTSCAGLDAVLSPHRNDAGQGRRSLCSRR